MREGVPARRDPGAGCRATAYPWEMPEVSPSRRRIMQGNKSRDTLPELAVRRLLHRQGFRYRVNFKPEPSLRRSADIVFPWARIAVFVDGCFWHACPDHSSTPRSNTAYWVPKFARNRERDQDTTARLERAGWAVLRYWEHEDPEEVAASVATRVMLGRAAGSARSATEPTGSMPLGAESIVQR